MGKYIIKTSRPSELNTPKDAKSLMEAKIMALKALIKTDNNILIMVEYLGEKHMTQHFKINGI